MATQRDTVRKAILEFQLETADAAKTVGDINKQIKNLQNAALKIGAGGKGFDQLNKKAAELRDRMGELGDSFKTFKGNSVERLTASMGLLQEGFNTFDGGKIKAAFTGIKAAMSALPIFLLIQGIQLLIENFDSIVEFGKEVFRTFDENEKKIRDLTNELEKQKIVTATLSAEINREIAILEAQGATTDLIINKKKELIDQQIKEAFTTATLTLEKIKQSQAEDTFFEKQLRLQKWIYEKAGQTAKAEETEKLIQANKIDRTKEEIKLVQESIERIKDLDNQKKVDRIKNEKEISDATKKLREENRDRQNELIDEDELQKLDRLKLERDRAIKEVNESRATAKAKQEAIYLINREYAVKSAELMKMTSIDSTKILGQEQLKLEKETQEAGEKQIELNLQNIYGLEEKYTQAYIELQRKLYDEQVRDISNGLSTTFKAIGAVLTDSPIQGIANSITSAFLTSFNVISDKSKQMSDKVAMSLQNAASIINSINSFQDAQLEQQTRSIEQSYDQQLQALEYNRDLELAKEETTAEEKLELENAFNQAKYEMELEKYNRENEIKKAAFETDKKLQIASTIMTTISGSIVAFTSMLKAFPAPYNFIAGGIAAAAVATMGAIQVNQIAKTQFEAGSPPSPPIPKAPPKLGSGSGGDNALDKARVNDFSLYGTAGKKNNIGSAPEGERKIVVQANVNVSEVTTTQNKLEKFEMDSKL